VLLDAGPDIALTLNCDMLKRVQLNGYTVIADKCFAGEDFGQLMKELHTTFLRPDRKDEEPRLGKPRRDTPMDRIDHRDLHKAARERGMAELPEQTLSLGEFRRCSAAPVPSRPEWSLGFRLAWKAVAASSPRFVAATVREGQPPPEALVAHCGCFAGQWAA
jgi:hypothetical protein